MVNRRHERIVPRSQPRYLESQSHEAATFREMAEGRPARVELRESWNLTGSTGMSAGLEVLVFFYAGLSPSPVNIS